MVPPGRGRQRTFQALTPGGHLAQPSPPPHTLCLRRGKVDGCVSLHPPPSLCEKPPGWVEGGLDSFGAWGHPQSCSPGLRGQLLPYASSVFRGPRDSTPRGCCRPSPLGTSGRPAQTASNGFREREVTGRSHPVRTPRVTRLGRPRSRGETPKVSLPGPPWSRARGSPTEPHSQAPPSAAPSPWTRTVHRWIEPGRSVDSWGQRVPARQGPRPTPRCNLHVKWHGGGHTGRSGPQTAVARRPQISPEATETRPHYTVVSVATHSWAPTPSPPAPPLGPTQASPRSGGLTAPSGPLPASSRARREPVGPYAHMGAPFPGGTAPRDVCKAPGVPRERAEVGGALGISVLPALYLFSKELPAHQPSSGSALGSPG